MATLLCQVVFHRSRHESQFIVNRAALIVNMMPSRFQALENERIRVRHIQIPPVLHSNQVSLHGFLRSRQPIGGRAWLALGRWGGVRRIVQKPH